MPSTQQAIGVVPHWGMSVEGTETFNHSANIYLAHVGLGCDGEQEV